MDPTTGIECSPPALVEIANPMGSGPAEATVRSRVGTVPAHGASTIVVPAGAP
jgi:hypothetical protein